MNLTYEDMREKLERIHRIIFELLCDIDDFCRENNITYYLGGGTCLGAARHHGFIPWDGDGDIMLPRKDYEKLVHSFGEAYPEKYAVGELKEREGWYRPFAKIWSLETKVRLNSTQEVMMGVHVDVFPMDGVPDAKWKQKLLYKRVSLLGKVQRALICTDVNQEKRYKTAKRIIYSAIKMFFRDPVKAARHIGQAIENGSRKYDFDTSREIAATSVIAHYGEREILSRGDADHPVYLKFEGREFPVINGYKKYLQNLYGPDYMQIPTDDSIKYDTWDWWYLQTADIELPMELSSNASLDNRGS